jgi:hypothetical protein
VSIEDYASTDFTPRPRVPKPYVDTANLLKAVTGQRPQYFYDGNAGEWTLFSSAETGIWPSPYGYSGDPIDGGDATSMLLSMEEREDGDPGNVWLHIEGDFGEVYVRLSAEEARLWSKLLKKAAKKVEI